MTLFWGENDKIVPVDSVFCRTTAVSDGDNSLLKVNSWAGKDEYVAEFDHLEFGGNKYRIKDDPDIYIPIYEGFSDWIVAANINSFVTTYDDHYIIEYAESEIEVQYNVPNGEHDRVALVIYGQDGDLNWHVGGICAENCHFVCRIKENTKKKILEELPLQENSHVFFDAKVLLGTPHINQTKESLRLVGYIVEGKEYWVATDRFDLSAEQIGLIYKLRWDIESFFAWWKRHLKDLQSLCQKRKWVRHSVNSEQFSVTQN